MLQAGVLTCILPGSYSPQGTGLHTHRPLDPHHPQPAGPPSQLDHPAPSMSVCLCLFSMQNVVPVGEGDFVDVPQDSESQLQEQEKRIEISCALATEASRRGRMLSGERGWASLCQGDRLPRSRGGSVAGASIEQDSVP